MEIACKNLDSQELSRLITAFYISKGLVYQKSGTVFMQLIVSMGLLLFIIMGLLFFYRFTYVRRIEIEKIEFLYGRLWQIDLWNDTKKESYRFFVEETELTKLLANARRKYAQNLEKDTARNFALWFDGCETTDEFYERLNIFVKHYEINLDEGFENLKKWNKENKND